MSLIKDFLNSRGNGPLNGPNAEETPEALLDEFKGFVWAWFYANGEEVILRRKILFISIDIKVKSLRPFLILILGAG